MWPCTQIGPTQTVNISLAKTRRQYLHFIVDLQQDTDRDARQAIRHACMLVSKTLSVTIKEGCIVLPLKVMVYIKALVSERYSNNSNWLGKVGVWIL